MQSGLHVCHFCNTRLQLKSCSTYCHYPDQLLTSAYSLSGAKKGLSQWIEEHTTGMAHEILYNSYFTKEMFERTFRSLFLCKVNVAYPSIDFFQF